MSTDRELLKTLKRNVENIIKRENNTLTESIQDLKDKGDFFYISNAEDLTNFINAVNSGRVFLNGVLTNNINFGSIRDYNPSTSLDKSNMIGSIENPYRGIFDGQNYTITISATVNHRHSDNSTTTMTDDFRVGLFNTINGATIKNLIIDGNIKFDHQNSNNTKLGGICAYAENAIFENCISRVKIEGIPNSGSSGVYNVGGIVGYVCGSFKMKQCGNEGNQRIHGYYQGGLIGYQNDTTQPTLIEECYNHGTIEGYRYVGGLIGRPGGCQQINNNMTTQIFRLSDWVKQIKNNENIWMNLRPVENNENIKWIGCLNKNDPMSEEMKNAYDELNFTNNLISINENVSNFKNQHWYKRLWLNANPNDTYPWVFGYYTPYHNTSTASSYIPERSQLAFNIQVEQEGFYNINIEVYAEKTTGPTTIHPITGFKYGGGNFDVSINNKIIGKNFNCRSTTVNGFKTYSTTQIYLQKGINTISLMNNYESRPVVYLKELEIAPCLESFSGRSYDINIEPFEGIENCICEIVSGSDYIQKIDRYKKEPDEGPLNERFSAFLTACESIKKEDEKYNTPAKYNAAIDAIYSDYKGFFNLHSGEKLINDYLHEFTWVTSEIDENKYKNYFIEKYYYLRFKTLIPENKYPEGNKIIIKTTDGTIKNIFNFSILNEENLERTSIIKNCYNNGVFDSYNHFNNTAHYSGGLFGSVNLNVSSLYHGLKISNCFVSGVTGEPHKTSENRDNAICASCSSGLAGIFNNIYYLNGCGRNPEELDDLDPDNYYKRMAINTQESVLNNYYFTEKFLTKPFIYLGNYPVLEFEYDINKANAEAINKIGPEAFYTEGEIGVGAFVQNVFLKYCILPNATNIPENSFSGLWVDSINNSVMGVLDKIYAPKCQYIRNNAFVESFNLTTFDCATPVTISTNGFYYAISFDCLILRSTKKISTLESINAFNLTPFWFYVNKYPGATPAYIYVPKELLEDYKKATNWSYYSKCFRAIEDWPDITGGEVYLFDY